MKTLDEIKEMLNQDSETLMQAYDLLVDIVGEQPELAKDVFATFKEAFESDKNYLNWI